MAEVTQADWDAAAQHWLWLLDDERDDLAQTFARHREQAERETVERIVAWLMREEEGYPSSEYSGFAAMIREEIEAGEWKQ